MINLKLMQVLPTACIRLVKWTIEIVEWAFKTLAVFASHLICLLCENYDFI